MSTEEQEMWDKMAEAPLQFYSNPSRNDEIFFHETIELPGVWRKVGFKSSPRGGESDDDAFLRVFNQVQQWQAMSQQPKFTQVANEQPMPIHTIQKQNEAVDMITAINACTRFEGEDGLNTFTTLARMNPEWNDAYRNKLIELKNKT